MRGLWEVYCQKGGLGPYEADPSLEYKVDFQRLGDAAGPTQHLVTLGLTGAITEYAETINVPANGKYGFWHVLCTAGPDTNTAVISIVFYDGPPRLAPTSFRDEILARIRIPQPEPSGSPSLADRYSLVHEPTWFWLTNWTGPINDSAARNGMQVAVSAIPTHAVWNPGDGNPPITCFGPGTEYIPRTGLNPDTDTNCSHTYTRSTAGQPDDALTITVTTHYNLTWELDNIDQGSFGTFTTTNTIRHQVGEIQVVNT